MSQEGKIAVLFTEEAKVRTAGGYDPIYEKGKTYQLNPDQAGRWYRRNKAVPAPAKPKKEASAGKENTPDAASEFDKMTKAQLIEFAGPEAGIDSNDTKAEIIAKIEAMLADPAAQTQA